MSDNAFREQYDAATQGAGVGRLDGWSTVRVAGADRGSFLHNMCTNDIRNLPAGGQCEAFLTDVKGKIVGHVVVLVEAEGLLLVSVPGQAEKLIAHLDRYIIREDVQLEDLSLRMAWSLVIGPEAGALVDRLRDGEFARATPAGLCIAPCRQIWPGGSWVGAVAGAAWDLEGATTCDERVWTALRLESGWPLFGVDYDGSNLPQEVGRDAEAISFRKGCYLGQETIARIDALGHVNKRLATVSFSGEQPPPIGTELTADGQAVGHVTSACWSPRRGAPLGLAMIRRGFNDPGAALQCGGVGAATVATPAVVHVAPGQ